MRADGLAQAPLPRRNPPRATAKDPITPSVPQLLSVRDVAQALGLSRSKVYQLIDGGELEAYRPGGRIRVAAHAVAQFLETAMLRTPVGRIRKSQDEAWVLVDSSKNTPPPVL